MASFIFGSTSIGTGVRANLSTSLDAFVAAGATVGSTDSIAIRGIGSTHVVQIAGSVFGEVGAIWLGDDSAMDDSQSVFIGAGAYVGSASATVFLRGQQSTAVNAGMVSGQYGFYIGGIGGLQSTLTNTGTITGVHSAILRAEELTERLVITNHGAIIGGANGLNSVAFDSNHSNAVEIIRNRGSIVGNIGFGLGDDIYDGRRGTIDGTIFGEGGDDTFFAGAEVEVFDGGAGNDTLNLKSSAGGTIDISGAETGTGVALGDSYVDIEIVLGSTSGGDTIIGSDAANTLYGFGGADVLQGDAGGDLLEGGAGFDILTGGAGNDVFRFRALADAGDRITDFAGVAGNNDLFRISAAGFGGGLGTGALAAGQFQTRADNLAQDADDNFIFRTTDRTLWFDVDGSGTEAALMVADLQAGAVVTATDIFLI